MFALDYLFVYGTLKRGYPNYYRFDNKLTFVREAVTVDSYPLYIAGKWNSPVLIPTKGKGHKVHGELFIVADDGLRMLDDFEGVDRNKGYYRDTIAVSAVSSDSSDSVMAYVYFKRFADLEGHISGPIENFPAINSYIAPTDR